MPIDLEPSPPRKIDIIFVVERDEVIRSALHFILDDQNETHSFASLDLAFAKAAELTGRTSGPARDRSLKDNGERAVAEITRRAARRQDPDRGEFRQ